ncbi:MAG: Plug domain-containing protein [Rhodocyclaceae bacterium]|nr:Plug domain-containing protein [Rhodocyclaceae bacterium]
MIRFAFLLFGLLGTAFLPTAVAAGGRVEARECPSAVTTLMGDELVREGTLSLDVLQAAPNVSVGGASGTLNLRGLGNRMTLINGRGVDATGFNGIDLVDLQRVEVLRGPQGALFCKTQDNATWRADTAATPGQLTLPAFSFVVPYAKDKDLSARISVGKPFGILNGEYLSAHDWIRDVYAPFSLLCRSDEGMPADLGLGDRFAFRVPGDQQRLDWVLGQSDAINPYCFKLPDLDGFACESAAGGDPQAGWDRLAKFQADGYLADLEWAGCEEFYPESDARGCLRGVQRFPEKALHFGGRLDGVLSNPFDRQPVGGAKVLLGPLSPTPFFDPGPRAGDEGGPILGRTDALGNYRLSLAEVQGAPIELSVAKGCAQHTTVAIADPPTPPTPRPEPPQGSQICGPDVTDKVVDILGFMKRKWDGWSAAERSTHCTKIVNPATALGAWDMDPFSPTSYKDLRIAPNYCAIPDWPCGSTVEFFGYCLPSQVVNYVQWGAMTRLCDIDATGLFLHASRDTANSLLSTVKNVVTLNWGQVRNPVESKNYEGQYAMSAIGAAFATRANDPDFARRVMKRLLDRYVREAGDTWWQMDGTGCAPSCEETAGAELIKGKLETLGWGFQWGETKSNLREERVERELKELRERRGGGG